MKTSKNEFLSALLDGEAGEFERRRLLDELSRDEALGKTLGRYALAGEVMRARPATVIADSGDFLAGIHARLEDEPVYHEAVVQFGAPEAAGDQSSALQMQGWHKNLLPYGMAATVAAVALAGVLMMQQTQLESSTMADNAPAANDEAAATTLAASTPVAEPAAPPTQTLAALEPAQKPVQVTAAGAESARISQTNRHLDWQTRDALKQYVTLHMQHRSNNGIVPSIQAVSYSK